MRHLKARTSEYMGVSVFTGKLTNSQQSPVVHDHQLVCLHRSILDDFSSILATARSNFELELKESLLIHRGKPSLNKNVTSAPLYVFQ